MSFGMIINSILLGVGLAMDAFSVSLANGLNESNMKKWRMLKVAGVFALFQLAMPLLGWICVSTVANYFALFEKAIPWIALVLLVYIGGKMLYDGIKGGEEGEEVPALSWGELLLQGVATSIDALSVGFTIAEYSFDEALIACLIIGLVTFIICMTGLTIGKKAGTALAGKAGILGGVILIFIGIEIFVSNIF
ncbi:MAG: manganese efflux pump [Firmicutes bacterium]|nr:manganese efflux pump [Bacillota bacterium]